MLQQHLFSEFTDYDRAGGVCSDSEHRLILPWRDARRTGHDFTEGEEFP
jgi:hypothetical protein